jgi:hypothetical protein
MNENPEESLQKARARDPILDISLMEQQELELSSEDDLFLQGVQ